MAERPYVLLSAAMSADGYLSDPSGAGLELSDAADWDRVDELRAGSDAIMVGAHTVRTDNPRLQVRSEARRRRRVAAGLPPSPCRVTMTGTGDIDPAARFFASGPVPPVVYIPEVADLAARAALSQVATIVAAPAAADAPRRADLRWVLSDLAARGIGRLMVEGGSRVLGQFLAAGLADEFRLAVAPLFLADPGAPRLLDGVRPGSIAGRMRLAEVSQVGGLAVLCFVAARAEPGRVWPTG